ncbi:MAG: chorismate synthase [Thermoleophilia bacterium]|nr:chorismate synthase [Thermoleophilia bacterium]
MTFLYTTSGESHGPELSAIVEGIPAGLHLEKADIDRDLKRRQLGYGRGGRMKIESDEAQITSGVRHGRTLGSPIAIRIINADFRHWASIMDVEPPPAGRVSSPDLRKKKRRSSKEMPVRVPRPGHADLVGIQKFGLADIRDVLERASARETAARVAVGAIARRLLNEFDVSVFSHVVRIGRVKARGRRRLGPEDFTSVDQSPVRCLDPAADKEMTGAIDEARDKGESLGGVFEVVAFGLVPGLGSHTSGPERLTGRIGGALMSIPAIKGAEIGDGFALAGRPGSRAQDEILFDSDRGFIRKTNRAGGLEGGMTTGETLVARAVMKPIPTMTRPLDSVDVLTGRRVPAHKERSDICAVPAAAVVGEAMVAIELARALLKKFAGDCIGDTKESFLMYLRRLKRSWPPA